MNRVVSVVLFYDQNLNILLQDRRSYSKFGEKYGFWGGGIAEGESPEQAIKRELIEELNYSPKEITYWGHYSFNLLPTKGTYHGELFLSPVTNKLLNTKVIEGDGKLLVPLDVLIKNENNEIGPVTTDFLKPIKEDLKKIIANQIRSL